MKRIVFCMCLILVSLSTYAQRKIEGTYKDELGYKVVIKDSVFYYIEHEFYWANDTLAVCSITKRDDGFIELNSIQSYYQKMYQGMTIRNDCSSDMNDSIEIHFAIPYDLMNLDLYISLIESYNIEKIKLTFSQTNKSVKIPRSTKRFKFRIAPSIIYRNNLGLRYVDFKEIEVKENTNHIYLDIPSITNDFFEKYYVDREYAKVTSNKIVWKGRTFKIVKKQALWQDIMSGFHKQNVESRKYRVE